MQYLNVVALDELGKLKKKKKKNSNLDMSKHAQCKYWKWNANARTENSSWAFSLVFLVLNTERKKCLHM